MATRFVNVDRNTPMQLPPGLHKWGPDGDMVHVVIEAVAGMNRPTLKLNWRGCGSEQYLPKMMLQLLIYYYVLLLRHIATLCCYANGIFSSRRLERTIYRDVAVRFLAADTHPDHEPTCVPSLDSSA